MLQRVEVVSIDGTVEVVDGDDIGVKDGALHVWFRHYADARADLPDVHLGSYPLATVRRWRLLSEGTGR